jgi:hypothetical protein
MGKAPVSFMSYKWGLGGEKRREMEKEEKRREKKRSERRERNRGKEKI